MANWHQLKGRRVKISCSKLKSGKNIMYTITIMVHRANVYIIFIFARLYFNVFLCCLFLPVISPPLGSACRHTMTRLFKLVTFVANQDLGNPGTNPVFLDLVHPRVEAHQGPDVVDVIHKHNCINISEIPRI